jgi:serine/threonine-protein kinase
MTQLSRYILLEKIGSSVLGALYKAQDTATGSLVALKVLQLGLLDDVSRDEMDARLQRDFEAATRLQHPGIARVFEIRRDGRTALIASELVEGPTITSLTKNQTGSDLSQVVAATVQLLEALDFAHIQSVIHRDV